MGLALFACAFSALPDRVGAGSYRFLTGIDQVATVAHSAAMDLSPDFMGIREPAYDTQNLFQLHTSQVEQVFMVMPALAFDTNGNRIGYGKGYYDRYLTRLPIINRLGICYDFQITNLLPCTTQDIRATMVISDKRILRCH